MLQCVCERSRRSLPDFGSSMVLCSAHAILGGFSSVGPPKRLREAGATRVADQVGDLVDGEIGPEVVGRLAHAEIAQNPHRCLTDDRTEADHKRRPPERRGLREG